MATAARIAVGVAGVAMIASGIGAPAGATLLGSTFLATVAEGAAITGGALTIYGDATKNKSLMTAGMLIGTAGSIGDMALAAPTVAAPEAPSVATGGADFINGAPAPSGVLSGANAGNPLYTPPTAMPVGNAMDSVVNGFNPASVADAAQPMTAAQAIQAGNAQLMKYSLISGGINGAGNAYAARTQADIAAQQQEEQRQLQTEMWQRANSVGNVDMSGNPVPPGMLQSGVAIPPNIVAPPIGQQNPAGLAPPPAVKQPTTIQYA